MKKLGLIGGMSWESTASYYKIINEKVRAELGGNSSADMIIRSLELAKIEWLQDNGRWDAVASILTEAAGELEGAGADFIVMASNTVHKVYDEAVVGKVRCETKALFVDVINEMAQRGARGVILGCTELGLMITLEDSSLPLFDTAVLHAEKAAEEMLIHKFQ